MFGEGGQLGGEGEGAAAMKPIERLFAEAIAAEEEAFFLHVPKGEGPHAVELMEKASPYSRYPWRRTSVSEWSEVK